MKNTMPLIKQLIPFLIAGLIIPAGFAPFHQSGLAILGMGIFFYLILLDSTRFPLLGGMVFGLGFFGLGVSWVYVSIHLYGHLNPLLAALITLLFILYLSLYTGLFTLLFRKFYRKTSMLITCLSFSALWCVIEYIRATLFGGFPWLLLGFSQMDTPMRYLLPLIGIYGVSFLVCLAATFLVAGVQQGRKNRFLWVFTALLIILGPAVLKEKSWTHLTPEAQEINVIQANLSMREKWDETIFWNLLTYYQQKIDLLLKKNQIIILPESALPVPPSYVAEMLDALHAKTKDLNSAILMGIPQPATVDEAQYYNSLITLGDAEGFYLKQHLVPFGEYIPSIFKKITQWLDLPTSNMMPGKSHQQMINVRGHTIATLICYELAYPSLLRDQLPQAEWIVSISDDGWFGHSFAMYQQLQMAQALSQQTGRYQVLANNDGLSSVITDKGEISASLPAFKAETLHNHIYPAAGRTPWVIYGDFPILFIFLFLLCIPILNKISLLRLIKNQSEPMPTKV
jgi:apolipoprotein N-acyltransferase